MKPRKHEKLIKAWAEGAVIEFLWEGNESYPDEWCLCVDNIPSWEDETEYRIAPIYEEDLL